MRFVRGDVKGPHRFGQNRPRTFVTALQPVAAARKSKNQLSRNFRRRSKIISERNGGASRGVNHCNPCTSYVAMHESGCGTNRTSADVCNLVAIGGKPDMARNAQFGPVRTCTDAAAVTITQRPCSTNPSRYPLSDPSRERRMCALRVPAASAPATAQPLSFPEGAPAFLLV
jgi:hypothetical protein